MDDAIQDGDALESDEQHEPDDVLDANERDVLQAIGARIAEARGENSQRWLADLVGTTQTSIRRLERGETSVSVTLLVRSAKVLGLDVQELVADIEPELTLVDSKYAEYSDFIEQRTSAMGLRSLDFHTKRELLKLLSLWPR